ncbi:hypothetical protein DVR12_07660 [Chitinophaga silvatica]|uniref:Uncharacterized protein n=1 Tax=Chitinophaga silvatica TaxID=2282649 RepID=A0A3E1YES1_9BACT|nr:hypothetical protein [Chitinophaga silvatica]RFS25052.1 hypothetical protein DVR12_07660 [Chitinophaga silvatica]
MGGLTETWFADGYIDFELKKYTLLAYLQDVNRYFNESKLYPQLTDIIFHYNNLIAFRDNKQYLQQQFPKRLTAVNLQKLELLYEQMIADDELMEELEDIIQYSITQMNNTIKEGTDIYEWVAGQLTIFPVGLVPLESQEGYLLLCDGSHRQTLVYNYRLTIFERHDEKYRGIHTSYVSSYQQDFVHTINHIKFLLIREQKQLPNPAVYCIETPLVMPIDETLLPIAKRSLVKYIAQQAA